MRKLILLFMVGIGLSGCGGNDNNSKPNNNNQSQNDPVLKETLSLTNQPQSNYETRLHRLDPAAFSRLIEKRLSLQTRFHLVGSQNFVHSSASCPFHIFCKSP